MNTFYEFDFSNYGVEDITAEVKILLKYKEEIKTFRREKDMEDSINKTVYSFMFKVYTNLVDSLLVYCDSLLEKDEALYGNTIVGELIQTDTYELHLWEDEDEED